MAELLTSTAIPKHQQLYTLSVLETTYIRKAAHLICDQADAASEQGDFETASEKRDKAHNMLQEKGFVPISGGTYRSVYILPDGDHVVKFSTGIADNEENKAELRNWRLAPSIVKQHLATIDEARSDTDDCRYIIQERVDDEGVNEDLASALRAKFERNGFRVDEIDAFNVGIRHGSDTVDGEILYNGNGTLVAYDYAGK